MSLRQWLLLSLILGAGIGLNIQKDKCVLFFVFAISLILFVRTWKD